MSENEKDKLLKSICTVIKIGQKYKVIGRDLQNEGQRIIDEASAVKAIIELPFAGIDFSTQNTLWGGTIISGLDNLQHFNNRVPLESSSGSPVAQIYNSAPALFSEAQTFSTVDREYGKVAIARLCQQVESENTKEETIKLLKEYGFEKGYGEERSPLELFEIGYAAFERPVTEGNPAITSLIPIRSCIDSLVTVLLRRRITQEPASNEINKIRSIGKQLRYDVIVDEAIETWALEYHELSNLLSTAKMQNIDRNTWRRILQRAMNFIIGFLGILDPKK